MRLICTITDQSKENPYEFSYFLASEGIENECEETRNPQGYIYRIWVYEEDDFDKSLELYKEYQKNPEDPRYRARSPTADRLQKGKFSQKTAAEQKEEVKPRRRFLSPSPYGPISILILIAVLALFILSQLQRGTYIPPKIQGVIQAPILAPVEKALLYDYPYYFTLRDQLLKEYTDKEIEEQKPPSSQAMRLIKKLQATSVWLGFYDRFLKHWRQSDSPLGYQGPMFEKIRQGEVWRLFTPALLHLDLLHIFFNVLWFILLGNQIEFRLGWWRYFLLILGTAIISNTAQYLMSGPFFMGLSGTVVGMAAFIWARQQRAPWEGYLLHRFTLIFLAIFVIGMFVLQAALFIMQMTGTLGWTVGIANTAHLIGALVGYLFGRTSYFSIRHKINK
jgi:GlpG protein